MNVGLLCESAMKYQVPLTSLFSFSFLYVWLKKSKYSTDYLDEKC